MVADRRAGPAGVAAAGRAELPTGDAAAGCAHRTALAPSHGAGVRRDGLADRHRRQLAAGWARQGGLARRG